MKKAIELLKTKIWLVDFEINEGVTEERRIELEADRTRLESLLNKLNA